MKLTIAMQILKILQGNKVVTAEAIGKKCEISTRTVYRYLDELTICGIPIQTKRGARNGGVYIPDDYKAQKDSLLKLINT